jgi:hypothetical protein
MVRYLLNFLAGVVATVSGSAAIAGFWGMSAKMTAPYDVTARWARLIGRRHGR